MVLRTVFTILVAAFALAGSLAYVAFYADGFTLFQKIAVVLIASILGAAGISIVWVAWAVHPRVQTLH